MGRIQEDAILYRIRVTDSVNGEEYYLTTQVSPKGVYWTEAACKGVITRELKWGYSFTNMSSETRERVPATRDDFTIERWTLVPAE